MPRSNRSGTSPASTSPSLAFSVNSAKSSPLPSPKGPVPIIEPQQFKIKLTFDKDHMIQPNIRTTSTLAQPRHLSPPPFPPHGLSLHQDAHPVSPPHSPRRYHPYTPRSGPIPPGLHYAARSLGIAPPTDLTLDEVREQRDAFVAVLSAIPDRVLLKAFNSKRADHDCIALRLALATAEIKSSEERMSFLSAAREQHGGDLAVSGASLDILNQLLGVRGLAEVEANKHHYVDARTQQFNALAVAQMHMAQMYDAIGPGGSRWLGEDSGYSCSCYLGDRSPKDFFGSDSDGESDNGKGSDG